MAVVAECKRGEFLMADYLVTDTELTSIANAIRAKAGGSSPLEFPTEFVSTINNIPVKTASVPPNDVNFIDYDGTIVASYSAADFANLSALPNNPSHAGLTAQGWNWTLADAKAQVAVSGQLVIGQMYVTSDGKTRIYISIPNTLLLEIRLYWQQSVANGVTIDWGDGTSTETVSGTGKKNKYHTYATIGDYCITLNPTSGTLTLGNGSNSSPVIYGRTGAQANKNCVTKIELGSNVALSNGAIYAYNRLESITIPKEITDLGTNFLYSQYSLRSATIPINVSSVGSGDAFGRYSYSIHWLSLPKALTTFASHAFGNACALNIIIIPLGTTAIPEGMYQSVTSAAKLVIPSSVTSIGSKAFGSLSGLRELHFKPTVPPTVGNADAWTNLPTTCNIYVPSGYLSAYTSASNYPSSSTYTYIEE